MVNAPETRRVTRISTGRGGAANFRKTENLAKPTGPPASDAIVTTEDSDCTLTRIATQASLGQRFGTGRGGAGNILPKGQAPVPAEAAPRDARPRMHVSTGRGGAGNFKDVKSGRSVSFTTTTTTTTTASSSTAAIGNRGTGSRPAGTDSLPWAVRVPRIDADFDESAVDDEEHDDDNTTVDVRRRRASVTSSRSAPPSTTTFFGKMRRRLSSFGTALE